jgi:serine/threonine protein kinase
VWTSAIMIGTRIGQYRVLKLLGEGGMGRVLLAEHAVIKTRHALKMLHGELSSNAHVVQRFLDEARWQARDLHPAVGRGLDRRQAAGPGAGSYEDSAGPHRVRLRNTQRQDRDRDCHNWQDHCDRRDLVKT